MTQVVSFGQLQEPLENPYGQALREGVSSYVRGKQQAIENQQKDRALDIEQNRVDIYKEVRAKNAKAYEDSINNAKANLDFKKNEAARTHAYKTLSDWSAVLNDKTPAEQEMLRSSEHGKQIEDVIKTNLPEYYDKEKKQIMILSPKTLIGNGVDALVNQAKQRVASGSGTMEDIQLLKLNAKDPNLLTEALLYAQDNLKKTGDKSSIGDNIMGFIKGVLGGGNKQSPSPQLQVPKIQMQGSPIGDSLYPGANQSDPLGIKNLTPGQ